MLLDPLPQRALVEDDPVDDVSDRLVELTSRMVDGSSRPSPHLVGGAPEFPDTDLHVSVVVRDYRVQSITLDPFWFRNADRSDVEGAVEDAVNTALARFLQNEFLEATNMPSQAIYQARRRVSGEFNAAYDRRLDEIFTPPRRARAEDA